MQGSIILDFDSTLISVETLEILAHIVCEDHADSQTIINQIAHLTQLTMAGQYDFYTSLLERVKLLSLQRKHILRCIELLQQKITPSFARNKDFLQKNCQHIYIFSGGFSEIIQPIAASFNIPPQQIFANEFIYSEERIITINADNLMAHGDGKLKQLEQLKLAKPIFVIGDGSTDAIMKNSNLVETFYLFAENIIREALIPQADKIIYSFDDFINAGN